MSDFKAGSSLGLTKWRLLEGGILPALPQEDPPRSPRETLPTMYDLPSEFPEEPGLPDEFHDIQPQLLSRSLHLADYTRQNYFTASDLNLYYYVKRPLWHKRPDWFLAVGVPRLYDEGTLRRSYVIWQEEAAPYVIVEFLSPGTEREDLGRFYDDKSAAVAPLADGRAANGRSSAAAGPPGKLEAYEKYLRVPHYIVYSRYTQRLRHFQLVGGVYHEQDLNEGICQIWLADLKVGLGIWEGEFEGALEHWLRWCDRAGNWLLTDTEQAHQMAEQAHQMAEQERQMAERSQQEMEAAEAKLMQAAQNLMGTGLSVEEVTGLLGLSAEQSQALSTEN